MRAVADARRINRSTAVRHGCDMKGWPTRFTQQGVEVEQSNPDEFRKRISVEVRNWTEIARSANVRAE